VLAVALERPLPDLSEEAAQPITPIPPAIEGPTAHQ
jgi:hypothetical protein